MLSRGGSSVALACCAACTCCLSVQDLCAAAPAGPVLVKEQDVRQLLHTAYQLQARLDELQAMCAANASAELVRDRAAAETAYDSHLENIKVGRVKCYIILWQLSTLLTFSSRLCGSRHNMTH